jgi:hypothetical protein
MLPPNVSQTRIKRGIQYSPIFAERTVKLDERSHLRGTNCLASLAGRTVRRVLATNLYAGNLGIAGDGTKSDTSAQDR